MMALARLRFFLRKFALGIRPGDLVLDVGSGNDPHPRADVLVDKFVQDDRERQHRLVVDRPMVGGDLEALPFRDQAFDFVIASHVLEHVTDPARAAAELQRVAKRGYVETPAEFGGKLLDLPGHRWYVREEGDRLVFTGKSVAMHDGHLNHVAFQLWGAKDPGWMRLFHAHRELFFVEHRWAGRLQVEVIPPQGDLLADEAFFSAELEQVEHKGEDRSWRRRVKGLLHWGWHLPGLGPTRPPRLEELCACPGCQGPLSWASEGPSCPACARRYPQLTSPQGVQVPLLLRELGQGLAPSPGA